MEYSGPPKVDLTQMSRRPLLPVVPRPGLIGELDLAAPIRNQLRQELAIDIPDPKAEDWQMKEHGKRTEEVHEAELALMQLHANALAAFERQSVMDYNDLKQLPKEIVEKYNLIDLRTVASEVIQKGKDLLGFGSETYSPILSSSDFLYIFSDEKEVKSSEPLQPLFPNCVPHLTMGPVTFTVTPLEVVFKDLEVGKTYKAVLKVQNTGKYSAPFCPRLPGDPDFTVSWKHLYNLVAPGISVPVCIKFKCTDKYDHKDSLVIVVHGGNDLVIPLSALWDAPTLISPHYIPLERSRGRIDTILKSTIDCGKCFIGQVRTLEVPLVNTGADAKFFLVSDVSWVFHEVSHISEEGMLVEKPFYLEPGYFKLPRGGDMWLNVAFAPDCSGIHVGQAVVLCDNITIRTLDLIGESVFCEPEQLLFQDMEKLYNIYLDDDITAMHCLDLGSVYYSCPLKKSFKIVNTSIVDMKFHWELEEADKETEQYFVLPVHLFTITPSSGTMKADENKTFEFCCDKVELPVGRYYAILKLVIEEVPQVAIPEKYKEFRLDWSSKITSLYVNTEVWLTVIEANINITPNYIWCSTIPRRKNRYFLEVNNADHVDLKVVWTVEASEDLRVTVKHPSFVQEANSFVKVRVIVNARNCGTFSALLIGKVDKLSYPLQVLISCESHFELFVGKNKTKDFGVIPKGDVVAGYVHTLIPIRRRKKRTTLQHYSLRFSEAKESFYEECDLSQLLEYPKLLIPNEPNVLLFNVRTEEEQIGIDLIQWSVYDNYCYTDILSDVQEVVVSLNQLTLNLPEPTYAGTTVELPMALRNHRMIRNCCRFLGGVGSDCPFCQVMVRPKPETIEPGSVQQFIVGYTASNPMQRYKMDKLTLRGPDFGED